MKVMKIAVSVPLAVGGVPEEEPGVQDTLVNKRDSYEDGSKCKGGGKRFRERAKCKSSIQFSPLTDWIVAMRNDSTEILFQSFPREAVVSSFGMSRDVHCLTLSIQYLLCQPLRPPPPHPAYCTPL